MDPKGPINLDKLIIDLEVFINSKLNLQNIDLNLNIELKNILGQLDSLNIKSLGYKFPELQLPQVDLLDPNFKIKNPDFLTKINDFETSFGELDIKLIDILKNIQDNPILKNIPEIGNINKNILFIYNLDNKLFFTY